VRKGETHAAKLTRTTCARRRCSKRVTNAALAGESPAYCSRTCAGFPPVVRQSSSLHYDAVGSNEEPSDEALQGASS
jgi:hypothetical protein